jgi:phosphatidylserine decarboxylase
MVILTIFIILIILSLLFYKFVFLRDPERKIPPGNNIVAPADGKIINIVKIKKGNLKIKKGFGKVLSNISSESYLISIFMSLFNVHVNRAPLKGEIISIKHNKGKFFMAFDTKKSLLNENNEITMKTKIGKIKIIQIAGFLARRIQCFVKKNQKVNKGKRIGRIVIGSQVTIILPKKVKLSVKVGNKVKAGETIIASY